MQTDSEEILIAELPSMLTTGFRSKANRDACCDVSADGCVAIGTNEGLHVVSFHSDCALDNAPINTTKIVITPELTSNQPTDLGFSQQEVQQGIKGDEWCDIILEPSIHLARTTEPGIRSIKWSPLGLDQVQRCVVAALGFNSSLKVFSRGVTRSSWNEVVDLTEKWINFATEKDYLNESTEETSLSDRIQKKAFVLFPMAISWSSLFHHEGGSTVLLLMGLKSGHVAIWRIAAPLADHSDVTLVTTCNTGCDRLSRILWCDQGAGEGFFVCGYSDGFARACFVTVDADVKISKPIFLWAEEDRIPVSHIAWDQKRNVLVIAKGHFILLYTLPPSTFNKATPTHELTEFVSIETIRLTSHHIVAGLAIAADELLMASGDGFLFNLSLDDFANREELKLKQMKLSVPEYSDKMPIPSWVTNGFAFSQNAVHLYTLSRPGVLYDHLVERLPLKLQMLPSYSSLEEKAQSISQNYETLLVDVFVSVRNSVLTKESLPLLELEAEEDFTKASIPQLRIAWFIKHVRVTSNGPFCQENVDEAEIKRKDLICRFLLLEFFQRYLAKMTENLSTKAKECVGVLKSFVRQNHELKRCTDVMALIENIKTSETVETCRICSKSVPFTSLSQDSCPNGHSFDRCCQTLMLCQEIRYRKCSFCGTLALNKVTNDEFFSCLQRPFCSFCNGTLCRN